jgi:cholesterol transport system auxiliary component
MSRFISAAALAVGLTLGGCGITLPGSGPAPDLYDLSPKSTFEEGLPTVTWQLVVEDPTAAKGIDNDRIAVRPGPLELKYYPNIRWTDRAPILIQTLLIESFENSGKIVAVGRRAIGLSGDYVLKAELREFQAEKAEDGQRTEARVRINLKLIRVTSGIIIASESFERVSPAKNDTPREIVSAFDDALGAVLKRAVAWTLEKGEADYTGSGARDAN